MQSLKETGWKWASNYAFKIYNTYRHLNGWMVRGHPAIQMCVNWTFFKKEYLQFSTFASHICHFLLSVPVFFNFSCFHLPS